MFPGLMIKKSMVLFSSLMCKAFTWWGFLCLCLWVLQIKHCILSSSGQVGNLLQESIHVIQVLQDARLVGMEIIFYTTCGGTVLSLKHIIKKNINNPLLACPNKWWLLVQSLLSGTTCIMNSVWHRFYAAFPNLSRSYWCLHQDSQLWPI